MDALRRRMSAALLLAHRPRRLFKITVEFIDAKEELARPQSKEALFGCISGAP
jgi:hypothetical protein